MDSKKTSCFISYAHEDMNRGDLDYFVFLLKKVSKNTITVRYDVSLDYGSSFSSFEQEIHQVNAVFVLLTPSYKRKVIERSGGVYDEFKIISDRLQIFSENRKTGKKDSELEDFFLLIPVLFSGVEQNSIPEELLNLKYIDLRGLRETKDRHGKFAISNYVAERFVPEIERIFKSITVSNVLASGSYKELHKEYFSRLFLELKADWDNPRDSGRNYTESLFVKTHAFSRVKTQSAIFVIGRKGSGKTTIRDILRITQPQRYIGHVAIVADKFNLEALYSLFENKRVQRDIKRIFSRLTCFSFAWEAFIYLCCMKLICDKRKTKLLTPYQKRLLKPIISYLDNITQNWHEDSGLPNMAFFTFCFSSIIDFIEKCIEDSRKDETYFYADLVAKFNHHHYLCYVLTETVYLSFKRITRLMNQRFLISLDGFDSAFDNFRREAIKASEDISPRVEYEIDWLRSLLHLCLNSSQGGLSESPIYEKADYCITVPYDRFFEVVSTERDSYRYKHRFIPIRWSGVELAILLRKRLEELIQFSTEKNKKPEVRLEQVLKEKFGHIPTELKFEFGEKKYEMPLFLFVLRFTFWRPRDVLLHYATILAACEDFRKKGKEIDSDHLLTLVKSTIPTIIEREFLNEFESTIINIDEILTAFTGEPQHLSFPELNNILRNVSFDFASKSIIASSIEEKISFLYYIGFLGVSANRETQQRLNIKSSHAFYFNEGDAPINAVNKKGYEDYTFIIHPIFVDRLRLKIMKQELILNYDWSYLHENEALLSTL